MEKRSLDRRTFVIGSAGFGMAVLAGGAMAGCAAGAPDEHAETPEQQQPQPAPGPAEPEPEAAATTSSATGAPVYFTRDISLRGSCARGRRWACSPRATWP